MACNDWDFPCRQYWTAPSLGIARMTTVTSITHVQHVHTHVPPLQSWLPQSRMGGVSERLPNGPHCKDRTRGSIRPHRKAGDKASISPHRKAGDKASIRPHRKAGDKASISPHRKAGDKASIRPHRKAGDKASIRPHRKAGDKASIRPHRKAGDKATQCMIYTYIYETQHKPQAIQKMLESTQCVCECVSTVCAHACIKTTTCCTQTLLLHPVVNHTEYKNPPTTYTPKAVTHPMYALRVIPLPPHIHP